MITKKTYSTHSVSYLALIFYIRPTDALCGSVPNQFQNRTMSNQSSPEAQEYGEDVRITMLGPYGPQGPQEQSSGALTRKVEQLESLRVGRPLKFESLNGLKV